MRHIKAKWSSKYVVVGSTLFNAIKLAIRLITGHKSKAKYLTKISVAQDALGPERKATKDTSYK